MNMLKKFLYKIFELQESILRYKLSRTIYAKDCSKYKRKSVNGCTIDLSAVAETEKQKMENNLITILNKYDYNPEVVLNYIKESGTPVYRIKDADKILNTVGENEGFIYPQKGLKALYLSFAINQKLNFKISEMFMLTDKEINKYYFIYHLYNWYAYKNGISGINTENMKLLQKYLINPDTSDLQLDDIFKLKDAIRQDKASIEFVIKLCRNNEGVRYAWEKMKTSGAKL